MARPRLKLLLCNNLRYSRPSCRGNGADAIHALLREAIVEAGLDVELDTRQCFGKCEEGPVVRIAPAGRFYTRVSAETIPTIIGELERLVSEKGS